jgi:hypothetical protein
MFNEESLVWREVKEIRPSDVYGKDWIKKFPFDRYRIVGFVPPSEEFFNYAYVMAAFCRDTSRNFEEYVQRILGNFRHEEPRLIVEKIQKIDMDATCAITVRDVYGDDPIEIPEGFELDGPNYFRIRSNEARYFISVYYPGLPCATSSVRAKGIPQIYLRKKVSND